MTEICQCRCGNVHDKMEEYEGETCPYVLILTETGPKKINVIKEVRTLTNLGLKEAKELADSASAGEEVVIPIFNPTLHKVKNGRGILEGVGATVKIVDLTPPEPLEQHVVDDSRELLAQLT